VLADLEALLLADLDVGLVELAEHHLLFFGADDLAGQLELTGLDEAGLAEEYAARAAHRRLRAARTAGRRCRRRDAAALASRRQ
jgi:hypothetical protein